jgi:hypothetical protein
VAGWNVVGEPTSAATGGERPPLLGPRTEARQRFLAPSAWQVPPHLREHVACAGCVHGHGGAHGWQGPRQDVGSAQRVQGQCAQGMRRTLLRRVHLEGLAPKPAQVVLSRERAIDKLTEGRGAAKMEAEVDATQQPQAANGSRLLR